MTVKEDNGRYFLMKTNDTLIPFEKIQNIF
jgi:hypothetical protein